MKKRDIKVVKRGEKALEPEPPKAADPKKKTPADEEREMADSVKSWITEIAERKQPPKPPPPNRKNWKKSRWS